MNEAQRQLMVSLADRYETASFIKDDPSWFMHQVSDPLDQEMTAFLAMCLSYGSRQQFLPKIEQLMNMAQWHPYNWIASGTFDHALTPSPQCFYRLYTFADIHALLTALHDLLCSYGTLGHFDGSPVDLGLWSDFIDKRHLFIPLDTHVIQTANKLHLDIGKATGWRAVVALTRLMCEAFPDDPARADYALYGYDIDTSTENK